MYLYLREGGAHRSTQLEETPRPPVLKSVSHIRGENPSLQPWIKPSHSSIGDQFARSNTLLFTQLNTVQLLFRSISPGEVTFSSWQLLPCSIFKDKGKHTWPTVLCQGQGMLHRVLFPAFWPEQWVSFQRYCGVSWRWEVSLFGQSDRERIASLNCHRCMYGTRPVPGGFSAENQTEKYL